MEEQSEVIEIGDGWTAEEDTRLARFSGSSKPSDVTSVSNSLWMIVKYPEYKLFHLRVEISTIEPQYMKLSNESLISIHSPKFPRQYPNNAFELWTIQAPDGYIIVVDIIQMDYEEGQDFLFLGDGADYFSTNSHEWRPISGSLDSSIINFKSESSYLIIIFTTDGQNARSGFMIQCRAAGLKLYTVETSANTTSILAGNKTVDTRGLVSAARPETVTRTSSNINITEEKNFSYTPSTVPSSNLFNTIMIATFSATSLILAVVGIRWLQIKVRRRQLKQLDDRKYYEVQRMLPELPSRNWIFMQEMEHKDGKDHPGIAMSVSSSSENIYEIVPDYELPDLGNDSPKDNNWKAEDSDVRSSWNRIADGGGDDYTRIPDPLVIIPADPVQNGVENSPVNSVVDYEVIDQEKSSEKTQPVICARNEQEEVTRAGKVVTDNADSTCLRSGPRESLNESLSLTTSFGSKNMVRVSADVHNTFSGSPVTVENAFRQPKSVNSALEFTGF